MKIQILIVEDELIIAEDMKQMLEKSGYEISGIALNFQEALSILKSKTPDIVLADINLGNSKDGIDLTDYINKNYSIPVIFATSNIDPITIAKAKNVTSQGYLLKPFTAEDLYTSIEIAIGNFKKNKNISQKIKDAIFIKEKELYEKVLTEEILWLKSDKNYTEIITPQKKYIVRGSVKEILDELDNRFLRIHKSYVININKVEAFGPTFVIINRNEIPVGRIFKEELTNKIIALK